MIKMKNLNFKIRTLTFLIVAFCFLLQAFAFSAQAVTVLPTPSKKPTATPTIKPGNITPIPQITPTPTGAEEQNVKEIREAIKEKVNEIKDKIEKKAYVGIITQITDSTITLSNFRGKQRVRLLENIVIIGLNKKEIFAKDLAVDDKVIALGTISDNDILEAKRLLVVAVPKTIPPKRLFLIGSITGIDSKLSTITVSLLGNLDKTVVLKIDSTTLIISQADAKATPKFKNLIQDQKVIVVYPQTAEGKIPIVKTLFLLP